VGDKRKKKGRLGGGRKPEAGGAADGAARGQAAPPSLTPPSSLSAVRSVRKAAANLTGLRGFSGSKAPQQQLQQLQTAPRVVGGAAQGPSESRLLAELRARVRAMEEGQAASGSGGAGAAVGEAVVWAGVEAAAMDRQQGGRGAAAPAKPPRPAQTPALRYDEAYQVDGEAGDEGAGAAARAPEKHSLGKHSVVYLAPPSHTTTEGEEGQWGGEECPPRPPARPKSPQSPTAAAMMQPRCPLE